MFGLRSSKNAEPAVEAQVGALDRIGRRVTAEGRSDAPAGANQTDRQNRLSVAAASLSDVVAPRLRELVGTGAPAGEVTRQAGSLVQIHFRGHGMVLAPLELRGYVAEVLRPILPATSFSAPVAAEPAEIVVAEPASATEPSAASLLVSPMDAAERKAAQPAAASVLRPPQPAKPEMLEKSTSGLSRSKVEQARRAVQPMVMSRIDLAAAVILPRKELVRQLEGVVGELLGEHRIQLNRPEQADLVYQIVNDMMGLGPLEPLLEDDAITDIMINGPKQVYIEKKGKLDLSSVTFEDNAHLLNICNRIVSRVGRRVDEASPICDARLLDGSRVNVIVGPLAIDGAALTIRKFKKDKLTLDQLVKFGAISPEGATILKIIGRVRCNVVISGGTGSGKTTLLNCLTNYIDADERLITCEDAAELQLQQPHVVRLETRPPNLEGTGQVTMRDLVKNCLRMRPERIIVGEVRGPEAFDLLQAMNTGHDGSMGTLHANSPREALSRIESMITMGGYSLPSRTIREMICASVDRSEE